MKNILVLLLLSLLFSCTSNSSKKDQLEVNETFENIVTKTDTNHSIESKFTEVSVNHFKSEKYDKLLEKDTVNLILQYYGWGCPCPQWINPDSLVKFDSLNSIDKQNLDIFCHVLPVNDSLLSPFDFRDSSSDLTFKFSGKFYKEPQLMGDEGELGPGRTFLYHKVTPLQKHTNDN